MTDLTALPEQIIEVAVFAILIYIVLRFLRETRGSGVVRGLAFLLIAGIITFVILIQTLHLRRLEQLFETVANVVVIGLIIVFHPEIRRAIVHLGDSPIFGRFFQKESKIVQRVLRAVARMSKERIGALIAVEREASLQALAESGITIDAELNSFLIESVFYPKSALHDGAIVVRDDRIVAASCLLPLSQNPDVDKRLGTRHRAALGLSEETDALAIVVSEETGRISAAQGGKLSYDLTLEQLERHMDEALGLRQRSNRRRDKVRRLRASWSTLLHDPVRKLASLMLGVGLWFYLDTQVSKSKEFPLALAVIDIDDPTRDTGTNSLLVRLPTESVKADKFIDQDTGLEVHAVTLTVSGTNYAIDSINRDTLTLDVALPNVDWETVSIPTFTVKDLIKPRSLTAPDMVLQMTPATVGIHVVKVANATVTFSAASVELAADDVVRARIREESLDFSRQSATVVGPSAALDRFNSASEPRLVAYLQPNQSERSVTAAVDLQKEFLDLGLRLFEKCAVTVQLKPHLTPWTLKLPVRVLDQALPPELRGQFVTNLPGGELEVRINAGGELRTRLSSYQSESSEALARWARNNLQLFAVVPDLRGGTISDEYVITPELHVLGALGRKLQSAEYELADPVSVRLSRSQ